MDAPTPDALRDALRAHFGFDDFHTGQRVVIEDVLAGHPTVAIMPTGAGKSLCYQLPALLLEGVTVVVSPLIALMKDQVDALRARGVAADFVNSTLDAGQQRAAFDRITSGATRLVYVAPERFRHGSFLRALGRTPIALFAVDEAHCISGWGHDFRPDYLRLGDAIEELRPRRILACTATATPDVREDITRFLGLRDPRVHVAGFLRSNLFLEARHCGGDRDRAQRLVAFVQEGPGARGAVVVYASTRKRVELFARGLIQVLGPKDVVAYHAGMNDAARSEAQERFMSGAARIAVATNAFGMGVDRADVRAVVHVDLPRTVEGYYQQVGRAGRDRQPAHCLLLHNPQDARVHEFLIEQSHPSVALVTGVWRALKAADGPLHLADLADEVDEADGEPAIEAALRVLTRVDAVRVEGGDRVSAAPGAPVAAEELGLPFDELERHRQAEYDRLKQMKRFAHHPGCRHAYVLDYFGEPFSGPCPGCDRCHGAVSVGVAAGVSFEAPSPAEVEVVRKALAGVARARGAFGLRKVAGMLAGSKARDILSTSLPTLSTYGLLDKLGPDGCAELLRELVDHGLCALQGTDYPLIELTEAGWAVMQSKTAPAFRLPPHLVPGSPLPARLKRLREGGEPAPSGPEPDPDLVTALRQFRRDLARAQDVPAYRIFPDRTLDAIAAAPPRDRTTFLAVSGLGPSRWDAFGPALLAFLAEQTQSNSSR
jgi:ATP-dependent DNA helicase RecQ